MQNIISTNPASLTMSSREIAELTGKDLSNIHRDIRAMLVGLYGEEHVARIVPEHYRNRHAEFIRENADALLSAIAGDDSKRNHNDGRGFSWERDNRGYIASFSLDKTHTITLISGYNVKLRKAIIDRWQQLEALPDKPQHLIPQSLPEALRLAADLADQKAVAEAALAIAAPKAEALDRIATADGSLCLTDSAKQLQVRPKDLISYLAANRWIYKRAGCANWIGYQDRIQIGLLEHKSNIVIDGEGRERVRDQVRVTAKGLTRLAALLVQEAA